MERVRERQAGPGRQVPAQDGAGAAGRVFLFLQGPHGAFFDRFAGALRGAGARVLRIGVTAGDAAEWRDRGSYLPFTGPAADWPGALGTAIRRHGVTDLVLYGDMRPLHRVACSVAQGLGLRVHCLEEGYLRPFWITYERGGVNGNSALTGIPLEAMAAALDGPGLDGAGGVAPDPASPGPPPAHWGPTAAHMRAGLAYHARLLAGRRYYPRYRSHRRPGVWGEAALALRSLVLMPLHGLGRRLAEWRLARSGRRYDLVLLQLSHDSSLRDHSRFGSLAAFVDHCVAAFAAGAPQDMTLVFKTHPLEDGREPLGRILRRAARRHGVGGRLLLVRGGRLGRLLDGARAAVTVNSTAGQQALWRGVPLAIEGRSVCDHAGLAGGRAAGQALAEFFAAPRPPDPARYLTFRRFLLATSQVRGDFYTRAGQEALLRTLPALVLASEHPYARAGVRGREFRPPVPTGACQDGESGF